MSWSFRPGIAPEDQLKEIGETLGLQNLTDVSIEEVGGVKVLQVLTKDKKYHIAMTEVS
jgi:hypothetical protein